MTTNKKIQEPNQIADERTANFIKKAKSEIGFIEQISNYDPEDFDITQQYRVDGTTGNGCINIGKIKDGRYVAEYSIRIAIDDYTIVKMYFNVQPDLASIMQAKIINNAERYFRRNSPEFQCWECGCKAHWLDIPGTIMEKLESWKDDYCGC